MIRKYSFKDYDNAVEIFCDIYKNPPFSFKWIDCTGIGNYFEELAREPNFMGFVYEADGESIGFCFGKMIAYFPNAKYHIYEIFVKRDLQRKGIGSQFIKEIEKKFAENDISAIEIKTDRRAYSYNFYLKNGFSEASNIVTMIKPIKK